MGQSGAWRLTSGIVIDIAVWPELTAAYALSKATCFPDPPASFPLPLNGLQPLRVCEPSVRLTDVEGLGR